MRPSGRERTTRSSSILLDAGTVRTGIREFFVDMEKCLEERERLEERRGRPIKRGVKIASASEAADKL